MKLHTILGILLIWVCLIHGTDVAKTPAKVGLTSKHPNSASSTVNQKLRNSSETTSTTPPRQNNQNHTDTTPTRSSDFTTSHKGKTARSTKTSNRTVAASAIPSATVTSVDPWIDMYKYIKYPQNEFLDPEKTRPRNITEVENATDRLDDYSYAIIFMLIWVRII